MTELRLATSRFHAPHLIVASGLVPVGIVVSPPRWPYHEGYQLGYQKPPSQAETRDEATAEIPSKRRQSAS